MCHLVSNLAENNKQTMLSKWTENNCSFLGLQRTSGVGGCMKPHVCFGVPVCDGRCTFFWALLCVCWKNVRRCEKLWCAGEVKSTSKSTVGWGGGVWKRGGGVHRPKEPKWEWPGPAEVNDGGDQKSKISIQHFELFRVAGPTFALQMPLLSIPPLSLPPSRAAEWPCLRVWEIFRGPAGRGSFTHAKQEIICHFQQSWGATVTAAKKQIKTQVRKDAGSAVSYLPGLTNVMSVPCSITASWEKEAFEFICTLRKKKNRKPVLRWKSTKKKKGRRLQRTRPREPLLLWRPLLLQKCFLTSLSDEVTSSVRPYRGTRRRAWERVNVKGWVIICVTCFSPNNRRGGRTESDSKRRQTRVETWRSPGEQTDGASRRFVKTDTGCSSASPQQWIWKIMIQF